MAKARWLYAGKPMPPELLAVERALQKKIMNIFGGSDLLSCSDLGMMKKCKGYFTAAERGCLLGKEHIWEVGWAFVHSKWPEDVKKGIGWLEGDYVKKLLPPGERLYLLGVGYYRSGCYVKSSELLSLSEEFGAPVEYDWLRKMIDRQMIRAGIWAAMGMLIAGRSAKR